MHEESAARPRRLTFDTGHEMRRNTNDFCGPCECELTWAQMNYVSHAIITMLSGESDIANNITMEVHLNRGRLNSTIL